MGRGKVSSREKTEDRRHIKEREVEREIGVKERWR
jgi:hypothetical protein